MLGFTSWYMSFVFIKNPAPTEPPTRPAAGGASGKKNPPWPPATTGGQEQNQG